MSAFILKHDVVFLSNAAEPIATPQAIQNTTEENAAAIEKKIKANLQNYKTYATSEDIEKRLKTLVDQYTQQEKEKWIKEVNGDQSSQIPSDNKKIWREDGQRKAMKSIGNEILAIETSINGTDYVTILVTVSYPYLKPVILIKNHTQMLRLIKRQIYIRFS